MAATHGKEAFMVLRHKRTVAAGAAAALAIAGGGAAIAATNGSSPQQDSQAVVNDAAGQLGVSSAKLSAALKQALENRVDAEVAAGRLTQAQATELKARIESGAVPLIALGPRGDHRGRPGKPPGLDAAASYLGVTDAQLRSSLGSGKSLADVAKANGKSVDGLVAAMVAQAKQHIAADVAAGRLTATQQQDILSTLEQRITDLVNGTMPAPPSGAGFNRGGPPAFSGQTTGGLAA
jgi:hypothetical protein